MADGKQFFVYIPKPLIERIAEELDLNPSVEDIETVVVWSVAQLLSSKCFYDHQAVGLSGKKILDVLKAESEAYMEELMEIKIEFEKGDSTHHYILSRGRLRFKGDIRYVSRQIRAFRDKFSLAEAEIDEIKAEIINKYLKWRDAAPRNKVRY